VLECVRHRPIQVEGAINENNFKRAEASECFKRGQEGILDRDSESNRPAGKQSHPSPACCRVRREERRPRRARQDAARATPHAALRFECQIIHQRCPKLPAEERLLRPVGPAAGLCAQPPRRLGAEEEEKEERSLTEVRGLRYRCCSTYGANACAPHPRAPRHPPPRLPRVRATLLPGGFVRVCVCARACVCMTQ